MEFPNRVSADFSNGIGAFTAPFNPAIEGGRIGSVINSFHCTVCILIIMFLRRNILQLINEKEFRSPHV